eukprot:g24750.t2
MAVLAACAGLRLNGTQPVPNNVLLSQECHCQGHFDHAVVPGISHPDARCLQEAPSFTEMLDAQESLVNFQGGHVRQAAVALMARCRKRRDGGRLYWTLQLRGLAHEMRVQQVEKALLLCVPTWCRREATSAWIASQKLSFVAHHWQLQSSCGGLALPPRLGLPVETDEGLQHYVTALGGRHLSLSILPGAAGPVIYSSLPLHVPKPHFLEQPSRGVGAAVLFAGAWRFSERTALAIRRHLLQPLNAKVFAVSSGKGSLWLAFHGPPGEKLQSVRDLTLEELKGVIPPEALSLYEVLGSGALSPLRGIPGGFNLHALRKLQLVFKLVQGYEERRGRQFKWLIHSRLDLIWAANHPPLALMDRRIWTSPLLGAGDPHPNRFALNDWHAVVPRHMAPAFWKLWQLLLQGALPWTPHIEPPELLAGVLRVLELPLGEMDAVYCLEPRWHCHLPEELWAMRHVEAVKALDETQGFSQGFGGYQ